MVRLNIGCGNRSMQGFVGVDKFVCQAPDFLADINQPLPFRDQTVSAVWMDKVVEHIQAIPLLMREIHRVCRPDAIVTGITPHYSSLASWREPTHVHHLSYVSMQHCKRLDHAHYTGGGFEVLAQRLSFGGGWGLIGRLIFKDDAENS